MTRWKLVAGVALALAAGTLLGGAGGYGLKYLHVSQMAARHESALCDGLHVVAGESSLPLPADLEGECHNRGRSTVAPPGSCDEVNGAIARLKAVRPQVSRWATADSVAFTEGVTDMVIQALSAIRGVRGCNPLAI